MNTSFAESVAAILASREEKVVFAESCTCGLLAATLSTIPGISNSFCGSVVTYRASTKKKWLKVKKDTIKSHTTESMQVADEMVLGVLKRCSEADWAVSVVGHMGPDSPKNKDGEIFASFARRTKKGNFKIKQRLNYTCSSKDRAKRQEESVEAVFSVLARLLHCRESDAPKTSKVPALI